MIRIHSGSIVSDGTEFAMSYYTLGIHAFSIVPITIINNISCVYIITYKYTQFLVIVPVGRSKHVND